MVASRVGGRRPHSAKSPVATTASWDLDPHRVFILRRVAEKDDISMPELAGELQAASGVRADPASLSRWLIRNGLSFKKKPSGQRMGSARRAPGARGVEG